MSANAAKNLVPLAQPAGSLAGLASATAGDAPDCRSDASSAIGTGKRPQNGLRARTSGTNLARLPGAKEQHGRLCCSLPMRAANSTEQQTAVAPWHPDLWRNPSDCLASRRLARQPRGSVLVFSIVVLSILAMLGTAFLLMSRQSLHASNNMSGAVQADAAANAGLEYTKATLLMIVREYALTTPEGFFNPLGDSANPINPFHSIDVNPHSQRPPITSHLQQFSGGTNSLDSAVLSVTGVPIFGLPEESRFCASLPLRTRPLPRADDGAGGYTYTRLQDGLGMEERAYRFELYGDLRGFYKKDPVYDGNLSVKNRPITELSPVFAARGDWLAWIADLDSKFYAVPQDWGLDTANVPDAEAAPDIAQNILALMNQQMLLDAGDLAKIHSALPGVHYPTTRELALNLPELQAPGNAGYPVQRADLEYFFSVHRDDERRVKFDPAGLNINIAPLEKIEMAISQIMADNGFGDPSVKFGNKLDTTGTLGSPFDTRTLANRLAARIVAKRPFLCRMDFEDFLAAHIRGSVDLGGIVDMDDPGDITTPSDDEIMNDPDSIDTLSFARMIYFAIEQRVGYGRRQRAPAVASQMETDLSLVTEEIPLEQYLEMPGVSSADPVARQKFEENFTMDPAGEKLRPTMPKYQKLRFEFFFADNSTDPDYPTRLSALLTPKEFNNIINSISRMGSDQQTVPFTNPPVTVASADTLVVTMPITAGAALASIPGGDDVVMLRIVPGAGSDTLGSVHPRDIVQNGMVYPGPDLVLDTVPDGLRDAVEAYGIAAGPNKRAESRASTRPSYYSFSDDRAYIESFWQTLQTKLDNEAKKGPPPVGPPDGFYGTPGSAMAITDSDIRTVLLAGGYDIDKAEAEVAKNVKLYYRLTLLAGKKPDPPPAPPAPLPPTLEDARLGDLLVWRCTPAQPVAPVVPIHRLQGFFQMSFDADTWWYLNPEMTVGTPPVTRPVSPAFGPLQAFGDPDLPEEYASARPSSAVGAGDGSGARGDGDVAWSPPFAFRSRFFHIYTLARAFVQPNRRTGAELNSSSGYTATGEITTIAGQPLISWPLTGWLTNLRTGEIMIFTKPDVEKPDTIYVAAERRGMSGTLPVEGLPGDQIDLLVTRTSGERRAEAVYDAARDQILWQRSPISEKRTLGE